MKNYNNKFLTYCPDDVKKILLQSNISFINTNFLAPEVVLDFSDSDFSFKRIVWSSAQGSAKGGLRIKYRGATSTSALKSLALLLSLKSALFELPYGGSAGEIFIKSKKNVVIILQKCISIWLSAGFADKDILSPDLGLSKNEIGIIHDYLKTYIDNPGSLLNGKPENLNGCIGREYATSVGTSEVINFFLKKIDAFPKIGNVSFFGFGQASRPLYDFFKNMGYKITAISNSKGLFFSESGINLNSSKNNLSDFLVSPDPYDITKIKCDFFIAGFKEKSLCADDIFDLEPKVFVEIANNPLFFKKISIDNFDTKIFRLPGLLTNAGGLIASHYENLLLFDSKNKNTEKSLFEFISKIVTNKCDEVYEYSTSKKLNIVESVYSIALNNLLTKINNANPQN